MGLCSANYLTREVDKSLSGGELKRIEIATVLAANPTWRLTMNQKQASIFGVFDRLTQTFKQLYKQENGKSIIIISHQERIIELADEIICLRAGKIESQGSA